MKLNRDFKDFCGGRNHGIHGNALRAARKEVAKRQPSDFSTEVVLEFTHFRAPADDTGTPTARKWRFTTVSLPPRTRQPHVGKGVSHRVTETQRRFTAGALPQTPKASPLTSDKITGFYRIDRIFLISNPVNHDNPVILSKKHRSYPQLHSRA